MTPKVPHPARFSKAVLRVAYPFVKDCKTLFDPFCGVGGISYLRTLGFKGRLVGTEIEPEWANQSRDVGIECLSASLFDAAFDHCSFDGICTSPSYGNRLADHHEAKDGSKRHTYRHYLGRPLSGGSSAGLQWGDKYRAFHVEAWRLCYGLLVPGGVFVLHISDHIRKGEAQHVPERHLNALSECGLVLEASSQVKASRIRHGANHAARLPYEHIFVFRKPMRDAVSAADDAR